MPGDNIYHDGKINILMIPLPFRGTDIFIIVTAPHDAIIDSIEFSHPYMIVTIAVRTQSMFTLPSIVVC